MIDQENTTNEIRYRIADRIVISDLDTLMPGDHLLVATESRRFQMAGVARDVVQALREAPLSFPQLEHALKDKAVSCSSERLKDVLLWLEKVLVIASNNSEAAPARRKREVRDYLTLKIPLMHEPRAVFLTRRMRFLFDAKWMTRLMPLLLALQGYFCWTYQATLLHAVPKLGHSALVLLVVGNYVSLFLHELGHASACSGRGVRHGAIGFCIYLIYPAFYADVSEIWRLPRAERAVVDAGGMFMSLVCATFFSAAFLVTGYPALGCLALLCDITVLFNLNPFIRMDGYWLISDWLGVQNLMTMNKEVTWWLVRRALGAKIATPAILSPTYERRSFYAGYYCAFILFCGYLCFQTAHYIPPLTVSYSRLCSKLLTTAGHSGSADLLRDLLSWLVATLTVLGIVLYLVKVLGSLTRFLRHFSQPTH